MGKLSTAATAGKRRKDFDRMDRIYRIKAGIEDA
jgi:hypothetical protein